MSDGPVIIETERRGGSGWLIAAILVVALIIGVVFFTQMSNSEVAKDNAVTNAANNVGKAAKDVGSAAQTAADNTEK